LTKQDTDISELEHGDIFFFFTPKIETTSEEVKGLEDIQRFYMVIHPEGGKGKKMKNIYRVFMLAARQLPEIVEGKSKSTERNWALNILTTSDPEDIRQEFFVPAEYTTKTKGKRSVAAASPAGEGKYSIVQHDNHTELAYILELPEVPGPAQRIRD
jgi:hypothetical protein